MDLKAASRAPCKKCGGDKCFDDRSVDGKWYVYCAVCRGNEGAVVAVAANRPAALQIWNKGNEPPEKVEVDTSHFGKELDAQISALLASDDGQTSTMVLCPCPACGGEAKLVQLPTGLFVAMCPGTYCAALVAFVGNSSNHKNSAGNSWKFETPEAAIYAWNRLYPRKLTEENKALMEKQGRQMVYTTRPERVDKGEFGHNIFDDLRPPKDTEYRWEAADKWTHVSLSADTTPGDNT